MGRQSSNHRGAGRALRGGTLLLAVLTALALAACGGGAEQAGDEPDEGESETVAEGESEQDGGEPAEDDPGCTVDAVVAELEGLEGEAREQRLVELAQEEGDFTIYTAMSAEHLVMFTGGFDDKYGIEAGFLSATSSALMQRIGEEGRADRIGADFVHIGADSMQLLAAEGYLIPVTSPGRDTLIPAAQSDHWLASHMVVFVAGWNTDRVSAEDVPADYLGFADPVWEGRIAIDVGDWDWFLTLVKYYVDERGMAEDEVIETFRQILSQSIQYDSHPVLTTSTITGEADLALSHYLHIISREADRAGGEIPVAWEPAVEPIVIRPQANAVFCQAANPAKALLFFEFMIGEEGQAIVVEQGRDPANPDTPGAAFQGGDYEVISVPLDEVVENPDHWRDLFEELLNS